MRPIRICPARLKKTFHFFPVLILLTLFPIFSFAQGVEEKKGSDLLSPRPGSGFPPMKDWMSRLNLTEGQSSTLNELQEAYLRDTLAWRNELLLKRLVLRDMLQDPGADENQILARQREISELESRIQERALLGQLEMRKVLTPEQVKLLPPWFGPGGSHGHRMRGWRRGMGRE